MQFQFQKPAGSGAAPIAHPGPQLVIAPALIVTKDVRWAMANIPSIVVSTPPNGYEAIPIHFTSDVAIAKRLLEKFPYSPIVIATDIGSKDASALNSAIPRRNMDIGRRDVVLWVPSQQLNQKIIAWAEKKGFSIRLKEPTLVAAQGPLHLHVTEDNAAQILAYKDQFTIRLPSRADDSRHSHIIDSSRREIEDRIDSHEKRIEAIHAVMPAASPHSTGTLLALSRIRSLLDHLNEPHRSRLIMTIKEIAEPTPEVLERNGRLCRKVACASGNEPVWGEIERLLHDRYHVVGGLHSEETEVPSPDELATISNHVLAPQFFTDRATVYDRYSPTMCLAGHIDPEVLTLLNLLPDPEQSLSSRDLARRERLRASLTKRGLFSFGSDTFSHSNEGGFVGNRIYTQDELDLLGFQGKLELKNGKLRLIHESGADWRNTTELRTIMDGGGEVAQRIFAAMSAAHRHSGAHVLAQSFNNVLRSAFGLNNVVCWSIDSINRGLYGDHSITRPAQEMDHAVVCLADDVMLGEPDKPINIARYARSRISVAQFRELMLDLLTPREHSLKGGTLPPCDFKGFALWDGRIEAQTQGGFTFS